MKNLYGLSSTEYELMEFFWDAKEKVSFRELLNYFNEEKAKGWKKQTLSSFLNILQSQGLLSADKQEKNYSYYAAISREEHIHRWTRDFLAQSFDNSLGKFLAAFSGNSRLSSEEAEELRRYLDEMMLCSK